MGSRSQRSPISSSQDHQRQSLFFRDLASPISASHRTRRFATSDTPPPPPPVFTLEDRVGFSPEPAPLPDSPLPFSPGSAPDPKTPTPNSRNQLTATAAAASGTTSPIRSSGGWWGPQRFEENGEGEKGKGSPVDGVVTSSKALVVLPPLKEVAKAEKQAGSEMVAAGAASHGMMMDDEEWVTVYGYPL